MTNITWKHITAVIIFFSSLSARAAIVEGHFSEWYYTGPGAEPFAIDFTYNSIILELGDPFIEIDGARCNETYPCRIEIRRYVDFYWRVVETVIISTDGMYLDPLNQKIATLLPISGIGKITTSVTTQKVCASVYIIGSHMSQELANSCKGGGPVLPPIPSIPVTCDIEGLNDGIVDFGKISANEDAKKTITAYLRCKGDEGIKGV